MITCKLYGHNYVNEVQVTAQIFFPREKFCFTDVLPSGYAIESIIEAGGAHGIVLKNGIEIARHYYEHDPTAHYLNERRVVMLAIFHALKKAVGAYTPWGALTGIRPSKLVRE